MGQTQLVKRIPVTVIQRFMLFMIDPMTVLQWMGIKKEFIICLSILLSIL